MLEKSHSKYKDSFGDYETGGKYIQKDDHSDVTNRSYAHGSIAVLSDALFQVCDLETEPKTKVDGFQIKVNMIRSSSGWHWLSENEYDHLKILCSISTSKNHYYSIETEFQSGITLSRYLTKDEPRLRPTTYGNIVFSDIIGKISIRGREHPVYDKISII